MYVFIGITGVFFDKTGVSFPLNWQEPAPEFVLFQAILTLSPAEAEPLKKTYVKLCDAYGILGNLRLNAGEVRFWSLFKLRLLNLLIGCSPLHCPDNWMYISREDWPGRGDYFKNTSLSPFLLPLRCTDSRGLRCAAFEVTNRTRRELWRSPSCWPVGRHFSPGLTRDQVTQLISPCPPKKCTGKVCLKVVLLVEILHKCWCRFPEQSDNRFFWNRMLYLPYVRAGVSTSDWLIKVKYCCHTPNLLEASQICIFQ